MKNSLLFLFLIPFCLTAQETIRNKSNGGFLFTKIYENDATSVKDQAKSSTCWSFSTLSFLESELKRLGKPDVDLSEMFVVRHTYFDKVVKYVRMHGSSNLGPGGAFHDPLNVFRTHGMMPEQVYPATIYGEKRINHGELDEIIKAFADAIIKNKNTNLTHAWKIALNGILDAYFGKLPESFTYNGKSYTPDSFSQWLGLRPDDYIDITSYTHHPFYSSFILEIPDNWSWDRVYNLPLDEMMQTLDYALSKGFTVAWGADVSDKGFSHKNGVAIIPEKDWDLMSKEEKDTVFNRPLAQRVITQQMRQQDFDNYETTDDHGMQITGKYKDQFGNTYYHVKNSWGQTSNECGGYFFASESYVRLRTMNFLVHKDGIPASIRQKLLK